MVQSDSKKIVYKKMQCPICIEKITPSKKVACPFCEYVCCSKCVQTYLTSSADDANCMNCKRLWDRETLTSLLTKTFINGDLKKHRENMLLERETSMMPTTQAYVEQELQRRKNCALLHRVQAERNELKRKLWELNRTCFEISRNLNPPLENERRSFIHRCGNPDCRGFLSSAWKCNICSMYTCSECNALKGADRDAEHVCKQEDKDTMQLIRRECKKCPGCAQFITKIDGCDQMWCVSCHTAFSWRTGHIVNGTIHNPHFYQFQQQSGRAQRNIGDIPCGGIPNYRHLSHALYHSHKSPEYEFCMKTHRIASHIEQVELPRYNDVVTETNNIDLRVKYMLNELSPDTFKSKIQQREKASQKKRDIALILNMFITTCSDFFREMCHSKNLSHVPELKELVNYTNRNLMVISKRYDCVVPIIDETISLKWLTYKFRIVRIM